MAGVYRSGFRAAVPLVLGTLLVVCLGHEAQGADAAFAVDVSESAVASTAKDGGDARVVADGGSTPQPESTPEARDLSLQRPVDKNWQVLGDVQYRALAIRDDDPANDQRMLYRLQAAYDPFSDLTVFARVGVEQRFVSVEGESGVRMEDTSFGGMFQQSVPLAGWGWERSVNLLHRLRFILPTSFRSQQNDLFLAGEWMTRARVRLFDQVFAGLRGVLHYRVNQYAEQAGPGGEALPRFVAEALAFAEYSPLVSPRLGTLTVGADVYADETIDYPARDPMSLGSSDLPPGTLAERTDTIVGAGTSDSFTSPHFGFDLYVIYQPPMGNLLFMASLEQVGNAVRYNEARVHLFHRDETEFALRAVATY